MEASNSYADTRLVIIGENFNEHGGWLEARRLTAHASEELAKGKRRINFGVRGYRGSLFQHRGAEYSRIWLEALGLSVPIGEVYDHVAFTNHVKCSPCSDRRGRSRPSDAMWQNCGRAVLATELDVLGAKRLVLVGTGWNGGMFRAQVWPGLRPIRQVNRVELFRDELGREALVVPHPAHPGSAAWSITSDVRSAVDERPRSE